jgi:uncharacterized damage-inducible protein DinB
MEDVMTEKEMFMRTWEREFQTTLRVLKAYPKDKLDLKPSEKSRSARELLSIFAGEESMIGGVCKGEIDFQNMPKAPETHEGIVAAYEGTHREMVEQVKNMPEADFNSSMPFAVGPKQMGQVRKADILWMVVMDKVHHRGQLSVYTRMAGGKVPSIYGPTADEPWM